MSRQRVGSILAAAEALVGSSVTVSVANRYQRIAELFCKWCDLMGLPRLCDTPQLASWAWHYCEFFSWRSLSFHWCALQWWCDVTGNQFPAVGSTRRRLLQRCVRSLALSDPREEKRCFALCVHWLSRMQRADGLTDVASLWTVPLETLVFWTRVCCAHFAMMRLCEHEHGLHLRDLTLYRASPSVGASPSFFFELAVGVLAEGILPRHAANRKLKLRARRLPVLVVWQHPTSAGLLVHVMLRRLSKAAPGYLENGAHLLFPDVARRRVLSQPMSSTRFLHRLRGAARRAGMTAADVARLECRSLRAGGCTDFHANGVPRGDIMRQGGWTSDTVDIYDRPSTFCKWASFAKIVPSFVA